MGNFDIKSWLLWSISIGYYDIDLGAGLTLRIKRPLTHRDNTAE